MAWRAFNKMNGCRHSSEICSWCCSDPTTKREWMSMEQSGNPIDIRYVPCCRTVMVTGVFRSSGRVNIAFSGSSMISLRSWLFGEEKNSWKKLIGNSVSIHSCMFLIAKCDSYLSRPSDKRVKSTSWLDFSRDVELVRSLSSILCGNTMPACFWQYAIFV